MRKRVVIVGGGFAGLATASHLSSKAFDITLLDQQNYHLFQPLLYQVATGSLAATDIATPLRMILSPQRVRVVQETVIGLDRTARCVNCKSGRTYEWDILILAFGLGHSYFGHDDWAVFAPSLKYLNDAFQIRDAVLSALEQAEANPEHREALLRYVVVGGGPTGVELAGALGELTGRTLAREFRSFDPRRAEILVVEAGDRILPQFSETAARSAVAQLKTLGVTVMTGTKVEGIDASGIDIREAGSTRRLPTANVIWAAGASATAPGIAIAQQLGVALDRGGRFTVDECFRVVGCDDVYAVGDIAHYEVAVKPLPGLATVAEQSGRFVATHLNGRAKPFAFRERGQLAVIGRNAAVGHIGKREFRGPLAWWLWLVVHIQGLIGFDAKLKVLVSWAWKFLFDRYAARIIARRPDSD